MSNPTSRGCKATSEFCFRSHARILPRPTAFPQAHRQRIASLFAAARAAAYVQAVDAGDRVAAAAADVPQLVAAGVDGGQHARDHFVVVASVCLEQPAELVRNPVWRIVEARPAPVQRVPMSASRRQPMDRVVSEFSLTRSVCA